MLWRAEVRFDIAFHMAAELGDTREINRLLADDRDATASCVSAALVTASSRGHDSTVDRLLADPRSQPASEDGYSSALCAAAYAGRVHIVQRFLGWRRRVNPAARSNQVLMDAASAGKLEVVQLLLADGRADPSAVADVPDEGYTFTRFGERPRRNRRWITCANAPLRVALLRKHRAVVELLLRDPRVDPSADDNFLLVWACENCDWNLLHCLLDDPRVDPSARSSKALQNAARSGRLPLVDRLLSDPRVCISVPANGALVVAAENGHDAVVERLLADPRITPTYGVASAAGEDATSVRQALHDAMAAAALTGHLAVLDLLLADARVDPAANDNAAIKAALRSRQASVFFRLLDDPRVPTPDLTGSDVFTAGSRDFILRIIAHPKLGPGVDKSGVLFWAANQRDWKLFQQMLDDPRVTPSADSELIASLVDQAAHGSMAFLLRVLADPLVDPAADDHLALRVAIQGAKDKHFAFIEALLADPRVDPLKRRLALHSWEVPIELQHFDYDRRVGEHTCDLLDLLVDSSYEGKAALWMTAEAFAADSSLRFSGSWKKVAAQGGGSLYRCTAADAESEPEGDSEEEDDEDDDPPGWIEEYDGWDARDAFRYREPRPVSDEKQRKFAAVCRLILCPAVLRSRWEIPEWLGTLQRALQWERSQYWDADAAKQIRAHTVQSAGGKASSRGGSGRSSGSAAAKSTHSNAAAEPLAELPDVRSLCALAWRRRCRVVAARVRALAGDGSDGDE